MTTNYTTICTSKKCKLWGSQLHTFGQLTSNGESICPEYTFLSLWNELYNIVHSAIFRPYEIKILINVAMFIMEKDQMIINIINLYIKDKNPSKYRPNSITEQFSKNDIKESLSLWQMLHDITYNDTFNPSNIKLLINVAILIAGDDINIGNIIYEHGRYLLIEKRNKVQSKVEDLNTYLNTLNNIINTLI